MNLIYKFFILFFAIFAQNSFSLTDQAETDPLPTTQVFQIKRKGATAGFLLGMNHAEAADDILPQEAQQALSQIPHHIGEIGFDKDLPALPQKTSSLAALLNSENFEEQLPPTMDPTIKAEDIQHFLSNKIFEWQHRHPGDVFEAILLEIEIYAYYEPKSTPTIDHFFMGQAERNQFYCLETDQIRNEGLLLDSWTNRWPDWRQQNIEDANALFWLSGIYDLIKI